KQALTVYSSACLRQSRLCSRWTSCGHTSGSRRSAQIEASCEQWDVPRFDLLQGILCLPEGESADAARHEGPNPVVHLHDPATTSAAHVRENMGAALRPAAG